MGAPAPTMEKAPAREKAPAVAAGPKPQATVDGMEVVQAIQNLGGAVPLIAEKRTYVRAYLGAPSSAMSVRGELRVARKANGPWTKVSSFGVANLDAARSGSTLAQLRSRRENLSYSLDFRLPKKFTRVGTLWFRLGAVRNASSGQVVQISGPLGPRTATFLRSPALRLRVINFRYTAGSPPVQYAATKSDLEHLESWLTRAFPIPEVAFSSVTVNATAPWPFNSGQANAQVAALRALDVTSGRDPGTHYYGIVSDGGWQATVPPSGFMRGSANAIPTTPDPSAVASGPTGPSLFPWDTDGSYGDWYGGHELSHTLGRFHPGFCNGNTPDDPAYPFANGQLANADGAFTGLDVGDSEVGITASALPGTTWHDVMTYCDDQWLSSYTYLGIRDRLVAEEMLFPPDDDDDDDDDDEDDDESAAPGRMGLTGAGNPVQVTALVNLTDRSGQFAYVTPLPGTSPEPSTPTDDRLALRIRLSDGSTRIEPVVFKPDTCRLPSDDVTGLVDTVIAVDPDAVGLDLLLDGYAIATYEPGPAPSVAENLRVTRVRNTDPAERDEGPSTGGAVFSWEDPNARDEELGAPEARYAVQASTDGGRTWMTLAVGATDTSLPVDAEQFPDARQVRFRVLTTNGFSQTVAETGDLPVGSL
jgi:hypothetical protein